MSDYLEFAQSLASEIRSKKDKGRNLTSNWPTDGAHKENILKSLIATRLPKRYESTSGFVVTPQEKSSQIDLLIIDTEKPVLGRSGENVVFVTPDAVRAIVEVKTALRGKSDYLDAIKKISKIKKMCAREKVWSGLFVVEFDREMSYWGGPDDEIIIACDEASDGSPESRINCISVGDDLFVRYWENSKSQVNGVVDEPAWHTYFLSDLAPAYFIGNLIDFLTPFMDEYSFVWFPIPDGKETLRRWYLEPAKKPAVFDQYLKTLKVNGIRKQHDKIEKYNKG